MTQSEPFRPTGARFTCRIHGLTDVPLVDVALSEDCDGCYLAFCPGLIAVDGWLRKGHFIDGHTQAHAAHLLREYDVVTVAAEAARFLATEAAK